MSRSVSDPGFSWGAGRQLKKWMWWPIILQIFVENCMKMKEFGPRGGSGSPAPALRSANADDHESCILLCLISKMVNRMNFCENGILWFWSPNSREVRVEWFCHKNAFFLDENFLLKIVIFRSWRLPVLLIQFLSFSCSFRVWYANIVRTILDPSLKVTGISI